MTRRACFVVAFAILVGCAPPRQDREVLRDVYQPTIGTAPPAEPLGDSVAKLRDDLRSPAGRAFVARLIPDQAGVLWLSLIVILVVAFDFERIRSRRNVDLLLLFALGLVFFDVMQFFGVLGRPHYWKLLDFVFVSAFVINGALAIRALLRARGPLTAVRRPLSDEAWRPNLGVRPLAAIAMLLLALNVCVALIREPDDAGYFVNLGAQRLRERGLMPYGDPLLTGTPGAAYGPVLYAAHVPFQFLLEPRPPNIDSPDRPVLGDRSTYYLPLPLATKLCTIFLHLVGVISLFVAAKRWTGDSPVAWGLVALYCGSASVLGIGGTDFAIGGIAFISHIGPTSLTLAALAMLHRPAASGALLAAAAGAGFYPAFFLPAWLAYHWRDRPRLLRFAAAFAAATAIICGATYVLSRPAGGRGRIGTILYDTLGHHTDPGGYGRSQFGFWGQRGGLRGWLTKPLAGESSLTTPAYLVFFVVVALTAVMALRAAAWQLALLSAALAIGAHLLKIHSTGTYVAWAYPLLLLGFFTSDRGPRTADSRRWTSDSGPRTSDSGPRTSDSGPRTADGGLQA